MDVEHNVLMDSVAAINARFSSGNSVPVDRAWVPEAEWKALQFAMALALTPPEGWVELSHVEDILLQAETLASSGGADAESVVEWISESLLPAESLLPSRREVKP